MGGLRPARLVVLLVPAALLGGAWGAQLIGRLYPCEMCHWQRWPHYAALVLALLAFAPGLPRRALVVLAALAIAASGVIGVLHAGVEYHWWPGFTPCTRTMGNSGNALNDMMRAPIVRCDVAQWTFHGVSLAGFNALLSLTGALAAIALLTRRGRAT
ncbi:disulfide bond formation protein B [uncultured Sphingomonas sp.]|uniref:disulfide bond formation protein B n=1 Tax=uncultured Sphingomonas sp. TaxID=158754 RepID=UPI0035CA4FFB